MTSEIELRQASDRDSLAALSTDELRDELTRSLSLTAQHLSRLALVVRLLEERGEDLSDLRIGLLGYLRQIAYGQIVPEIVVRYAETPSLLRRIASLPIPDQRRLASGDTIEVVVRRDDGSFDRRRVDPLFLGRSQLRQVFDSGRIRDEAEQINMIESSPKSKEKPKSQKIGRLRTDPKRGGIVVGRTFVPAADVAKALASLHPGAPEDIDDEPVSVSIRLSPIESKRFRMQAARSNISAPLLAYRAVMAMGLLAPIEGE
jgi:hypothetical protein